LNILIRIVFQLHETESKEIRTAAIKCFTEFLKISPNDYNHCIDILRYYKEIIPIMDEDAILPINAWTIFACQIKQLDLTVYYEFLGTEFQTLLQNLLQSIAYNVSKEKEEAVGNCLTALTQIATEEFIKLTHQLIQDYLSQENLSDKKLGIFLCTYTLNERSSKAPEINLLIQSLNTICELLVDCKNEAIQKYTAAALEQAAEIVPNAFLQKPLFPCCLVTLRTAISYSSKVALHVVKIWSSIGKEFIQKEEHGNLSKCLPFHVLIK